MASKDENRIAAGTPPVPSPAASASAPPTAAAPAVPVPTAAAPAALAGPVATAAPAVMQYQLFARKAAIYYPPATASEDSLGEVEADDQLRYFVKGDAPGRLVRASEWLGTHIAEEVRVGAPTPMVIEMLDGSMVFGSRSLAGAADPVITLAYLSTPTLTNTSPAANGLRSVLSSIYALDLFIFNDDRHGNNYLSVNDNGTRRFYAFDFSRAMFWHWPWTALPLPSCNTRALWSVLRRLHGFDQAAAFATLDRLGTLPVNVLQGFIARMPPDWLPHPVRGEFVAWWSSGDRQQRIDSIKRGIVDGSLL